MDYNNDVTVSRPASEIVKIQILERRYNIIEAFEFYKKKNAAGVQVDIAMLQSRIFGLFLEIRTLFKRKYPDRYDDLYAAVQSQKYDVLILAYVMMDDLLEEIELTKIDTTRKLGGNIIERNRAHGVPI